MTSDSQSPTRSSIILEKWRGALRLSGVGVGSFAVGAILSAVLMTATAAPQSPCPPHWRCHFYLRGAGGKGVVRVPADTPGAWQACSDVPKPDSPVAQ